MKKCLFIVGMPRSGTKLLRDLCNGHSLINIPESETHFIPKFYNTLSLNGAPNFNNHESLYKIIIGTTFYENMRRSGYNLNLESLRSNVNLKSWESIFSFILQYFSPKKIEDYKYFGDKTPNNINHLPLLKKIFPTSKIVIVVRDPRDYCLSNKKIWNKNLYRTAVNWHNSMTKVEDDITNFRKDVFFIKYEDLINSPEKSLEDLCIFLEIPFESQMINLKKPTENYGDAKGLHSIKKDNTNKFKSKLSKKQIQKIEELSYDSFIKWYEPIYAKSFRKLSKVHFQYLKSLDGVNSLKFHIKEKGILNGTKYFFKLHSEKN